MCGINGFNFEDGSLITKMNECILHRGPDSTGSFSDKISLGFQRLAIIDLSEKGKQPMSNESEDLTIVFNGEIYNFQEIRQELEKKYVFKSHTDTEVILYAYQEWGEECVKKFNGMWALCIYDKRKNILFLSRDRFGKKPLYYYNQDGKFIFSSEIKAILKHSIKKELNKKAISSFLSYRYVLGEETFFNDIKKLLPAHNLTYNLSEKRIEKIEEYWDLVPQTLIASEQEAKTHVDLLLHKSVLYRKISDVPLGVILSGGLDSSVVTAVLARHEKNPINTFTVKFNEPGFDESRFAKLVAEICHANYFEVDLDTSNFLEVMKEYTKQKDEPIGVPNEIALYLLAKKIKKEVTVVLSGEGADEIFEGYGRKFTSARDYELLCHLKTLPNAEEIYRTEFSSLYAKYKGKFFDSETQHFLSEYKYWTESEKNLVLLPEYRYDYTPFFQSYMSKYDIPYQKKISYLFIKLHLPALLHRLDNATMSSSVEGRAPFLDYKLVEYAFNLDSNLKTKWLVPPEELIELNKNADELSEKVNISKYILKEVGRDYLPGTIVDRIKEGFPLPLEKWLQEDFPSIVEEYLLSENAKIKKVINQEALRALLKEPKEQKRFAQKIWMLLSLELWLREYF